ncbi:MAG: bifunctional demethylmenaquinone methyltransferase/2-methoxy-6-polyprenyl-1,4-benzoquinol methylase UbiE [Acidobacteriia bacterium]|nr:bifunctional demethylmenaquinone methyltransferase/2-methoxy-6-polyprenyl-1,4-benzoquinol methylase UbiE [Terriglobia bacterium]
MPDPQTTPRGTTPPGARTEEEASRLVREMFGRIAPRYDLLNHVLSLQLDRVWRWRATRRLRGILARPDARVLDLCCGTGDLALALARAGKAHIFGADFAHRMLVRAREKAAGVPATQHSGALAAPEFLEADALRLPFPDASFDLVTSAFGFRNLANYHSGLREILRVLKPGGTLAILDFTEPRSGFFGALYRWYFRSVLPRLGGIISGDRPAYSYLPASVARFFLPEELAGLMQQAGYVETRFEAWTGATVALHLGKRPR